MTNLTLIMSALGARKAGLHQYVVMLTGTMTFLSIKSCTTESAPSSYRRGTRLASVTFLGTALGFKLILQIMIAVSDLLSSGRPYACTMCPSVGKARSALA